MAARRVIGTLGDVSTAGSGPIWSGWRRLARILPPGRILPPLATGVVLVLLWEAVRAADLFPNILFPAPADVATSVVSQATTVTLWANLWVTFLESILGFLIGCALGFVGGTVIALSSMAARALYPYVVLLYAVPRVALAPFFIALLGFGLTPKVLVALLVCFFPVLINTMVGIRQADGNALLLMRSMRASRWQLFHKLLLPGALPAIFGGMKSAITLAFLGAFVAEAISATDGIGQLILAEAFRLEFADMFGYLLWFAAMSLAAFGCMELIDRKVVFWTGDVRAEGR